MSFVKDNGGPLVVGAVIFAAVIGYIELRAPVMIGTEMDGRGLVSTQTVAEIKRDVADQKVVHKEDRDRQDDKIERIVDILLED